MRLPAVSQPSSPYAHRTAVSRRKTRSSPSLAAERQIDIVQAYRTGLEAVEQRHPLYPAGGYAAVEAIPEHGATWPQLQRAQWEHDRH